MFTFTPRVLTSTLPSPPIIRDLRLDRCTLQGQIYGPPAERSEDLLRIENVELRRTKVRGTYAVLSKVALDGVLVEGWTGSAVRIYDCLFRHVTVRGKCGQLLMGSLQAVDVGLGDISDAVVAEFYAATDWALDISEAEFSSVEFCGVPAHLVRRDAETQFLARLERVRESQAIWKEEAYASEGWPSAFYNMMREGLETQVIIAPKRHKEFDETLARLQKFRRLGILEPD